MLKFDCLIPQGRGVFETLLTKVWSSYGPIWGGALANLAILITPKMTVKFWSDNGFELKKWSSPRPQHQICLNALFFKPISEAKKRKKTEDTMRERKRDAGSWTRKRAYSNERENDWKKEKEKKGTKQMKRGRIKGGKEQISTKPRKYRNNRKQMSKQVYYPKNQGG